MSDPVVPENNPQAAGSNPAPEPQKPAPRPLPPGVVRGRHGKPVPRGLVQRRGAGGGQDRGAGAHPFQYGTPSDKPDSIRPQLPGGARRLDAAPNEVVPPPATPEQTEQQPVGPVSMTAEQMESAPGAILPPREGRDNRPGREGQRRGGRDNRRGDAPPPPRPAQIFSKGFGFGKSALKDLGEAALDAELEAAFGGNSAESVLGNVDTPEPAPASSPGGFRMGKVVRKQGNEVFISLPGSRAEGLLLVNSPGEAPEMGAEVEVRVEGFDSANGLVKLALKGAAATDTDWENLAVGMVVEARVTGHNQGGLQVLVGNAKGFIPVSQIDLGRVEQLEPWVNQRLKCVVTRLERAEKNLVLSRRQLLEEERKESAEKTWSTLEVGQIRDGLVRSVMDFGAFVDLGGVDGLIPVREMSWAKVGHPSEVVKVGDKVKVKVLRIDEEGRKLSLGLRQLTDNPWDAAASRLTPGTALKGRVTRLADFGAFVEIEPGVEGLVHLSELAPHRVRRAGDAVKTGDEVNVIVLAIDSETKRIGLSIKAALLAAQGKAEEVEAILAEAAPATPPTPKPKPANLRGGTGGSGPLIPNLFG